MLYFFLLRNCKYVITIYLCIFSYYLQSQIVNIESQRIITDTTGWSGNVGMSISASKNTKSYFTFNGQGHLQYKTDKNLILGILDYNLVNAGGEDFGNNGFAHIRFNNKINNLVRLELFTQLQFNEISLIKVRSLNGIGIRLKLSQHERAKFYYGLTYMYEYEEIKNQVDINKDHRLSSYFTFNLKPEENIQFSNTIYIQPKFGDFRDYRLSNDTRLIFNITESLKFITHFNYLFDTHPPIGVPKSTYEVRNGIRYLF